MTPVAGMAPTTATTDTTNAMVVTAITMNHVMAIMTNTNTSTIADTSVTINTTTKTSITGCTTTIAATH